MPSATFWKYIKKKKIKEPSKLSTLSERIKKLNNHLRDEVGKIIHDEIVLTDNILITVTDADVSPTLEHATIKISVYPKNKEKIVLEKIKEEIYQIQQVLNRRLVMRPVPKIRFEIDTSEERAGRIEEILQKTRK